MQTSRTEIDVLFLLVLWRKQLGYVSPEIGVYYVEGNTDLQWTIGLR